MGNTSNPAQWAAMERLRFIERSAFWRGEVNRQDLVETFGLSMAQCSADLQRYQELNPGAIVYNLKRKRYEGSRDLVPMCHQPSLEEAMVLFLPEGAKAGRVASLQWMKEDAAAGAKVEVLEMPQRRPLLPVTRRVFLAVSRDQRVRVKYYSVHGASAQWRWLRPHAFAHDGNRWHVRAWCETNNEFRDYNLSRIREAEWPEPADPLGVEDRDWQEMVTLTLRPSHQLNDEQRRAVELDFGMKEGVLKLKVRKALENYLRDRLHLPLADGSQPTRPLELAE